MTWNADRSMYYGTKQPDQLEHIILQAYARIHWLEVETRRNISAIAQRDEKNARG